jgi:hypothetical protein
MRQQPLCGGDFLASRYWPGNPRPPFCYLARACDHAGHYHCKRMYPIIKADRDLIRRVSDTPTTAHCSAYSSRKLVRITCHGTSMLVSRSRNFPASIHLPRSHNPKGLGFKFYPATKASECRVGKRRSIAISTHHGQLAYPSELASNPGKYTGPVSKVQNLRKGISACGMVFCWHTAP